MSLSPDILDAENMTATVHLFLTFLPAKPEKVPPVKVVPAGKGFVQRVDPTTNRGTGPKIPQEQHERGEINTDDGSDIARAVRRVVAIRDEIRDEITAAKVDPESPEGAFVVQFVMSKLDVTGYVTEQQHSEDKDGDSLGGRRCIARYVEWALAALPIVKPLLAPLQAKSTGQ